MIQSRRFSGVGYETTKYEFLVQVREPKSGLVIGHYLTKWAFNGRDTEHKSNRAWNYVMSGLNDNSIRTGFDYEVIHWGMEGEAERYAKERGIELDRI